ncbi:Ribonuclease P protein component 4 [uncultured archaeon]|nr:Ribonuclease P protein component 4 [uncultured archaeon]
MAKPKTNLDPLPIIAKRRIDTLLVFAKHEVREHPDLAKRYVQLARAIATRHRVPLGRERKHLFCKECNAPWVVGYNVKVRLDRTSRRAIYTCACGAKKGFAYSKPAH